MVINLPPLHAVQRTVATSTARFRVLAMGRRGGKTLLGVVLCLSTALQGKRAWWVAPTYPIASIGWRALRRLARQIPDTVIRESDHMALMPGGGWVQVRSADNPDSLRGEGLDFVVIDEAAYVDEAAWTEALRPALTDRRGSALLISTPNGLNWFHAAWLRGQDAQQPDWASWQYRTSDNPHISADELVAARSSLPERVFLQEFEAEFLTDEGSVFRNVRVCATATFQPEPEANHAYCIGADWGQAEDFSVFCVLDLTTREVVALDRSNQLDYLLQADRLTVLAERFRVSLIIAEDNSIGNPIASFLAQRSLPVYRWTASNATKAQVIQALALAFEQRTIRVPDDPVLVGELQAYQAERLPSGMVRYSAPQGHHDDCVMALALAWSGAGMVRPQSRDSISWQGATPAQTDGPPNRQGIRWSGR